MEYNKEKFIIETARGLEIRNKSYTPTKPKGRLLINEKKYENTRRIFKKIRRNRK